MITSRANSQVKYVRRLQGDRRFRYQEQAYVVEGPRWLDELAQAGQTPRAVYVTADWLADNVNQTLVDAAGVESVLVEDHVMAAMSDTQTPSGVLAVVAMRPPAWPERPSLLLILDAIGNPGNLGTMLRTAAAAGAQGVLLGPGSVDPYNPKALRGSMGAVLRLPVRQEDWPAIGRLTAGTAVWLATARGSTDHTAVDWGQPSAILIGSEAQGAGEQAVALATGRVTIPMVDATESLNAAVAAGVLLFEAARQRAD